MRFCSFLLCSLFAGYHHADTWMAWPKWPISGRRKCILKWMLLQRKTKCSTACLTANGSSASRERRREFCAAVEKLLGKRPCQPPLSHNRHWQTSPSYLAKRGPINLDKYLPAFPLFHAVITLVHVYCQCSSGWHRPSGNTIDSLVGIKGEGHQGPGVVYSWMHEISSRDLHLPAARLLWILAATRLNDLWRNGKKSISMRGNVGETRGVKLAKLSFWQLLKEWINK